MFKFAVKVGIAGGAVYYLADAGVWKESTETTKLYERITTALSPYVQEAKSQLPIEIPDLPDTNKISYLTKQYWNDGVTKTLTYLGDLPKHVSDWTVQGVEAVKRNPQLKNFVDSFSNDAKPENKDVKMVDRSEEQ